MTDAVLAHGSLRSRTAIAVSTMCSARTHPRLTSWTPSPTGLPVLCVDDRLAPRHRFPAAADDVRAGYVWPPRATGLLSERTAIAGDAAGGHPSADLPPQTDAPAGITASLPKTTATEAV